MAFEDALSDIATKVADYSDSLSTEEATKTAIIMPFIGRVLGYDVFNPQEVIPEFVADVGLKKGEKIDFAVMREGQVQMLIEAKKIGEPLNLEHASQLVRYFSASDARVGVLTNGRQWNFYTDLDKPNIMDDKPFLRLDLLNIDTYLMPELRKLTKDSFDLDSVLVAAEELKYVSALKRAVSREFEHPSDDFVKLLTQRVYEGSFTQRVREIFTPLTSKALNQFVNDQVNERLKSALGSGTTSVASPTPTGPVESQAGETTETVDDGIETTLVELEGFRVVRAIVASEVPYERVAQRDQKSYFAILLDDNNRKPIARLHFNRRQMFIGLFDADKTERREPINSVEEIYTYADELRDTVRGYL